MIIIVVNIHPNNIIVNGLIFRETNRFAMKPFQMRSKIQIGAFDLPGILFANSMLRGRNRFRIALPIVGIIGANGKDRQFIEQLLTGGIRALVVVMRQNRAADALECIPCPPLVRLGPDIAPELIRFHANVDVKPRHRIRLQTLGESPVDLDRRFFFSAALTVFLAIPSVRLMSRTPLPFSVCASICSFVPGCQA